ncbi:MAG: hypothetical protein H0W90_15670 [Actinobacteria bacterium]|nr:hypothetical protein [Actinomycetota bacterium]
MARTDRGVHFKPPQFVWDELEDLVVRLGGEASKTRLLAALVHDTTIDSARKALRKYSGELAKRSPAG